MESALQWHIKKELPYEINLRIYDYQSDRDAISGQRANDFWLFGYFANGIIPKNIVFLKSKNNFESYIVFDRSKTERAIRSAHSR